ncbi:DUF1444 family protein [Cohnella sp.]|uniref:DUF1444 family protein n=1 Tax=Cohnella sp. TaxID=1883426 RepID=UPI0035667FDB
MRPARLYDAPEQFAEMMMKHLSESMNVLVQKTEEPLLLEINVNLNDPQEKIQVSLHNTFRTYMASGDMNTAIDYLNDTIRCTELMRTKKDDVVKLDSAYIYPAIRDTRYVEEAGKNVKFISEAYLPGLSVIYLEIKDSCSKIITEASLEYNPRLTEERVKHLAYRNLRTAGWQSSRLTLQSPFRESCCIEVFMDNSHPIECQFLLPEMATSNLPKSCLIAYTNRKTAMIMYSNERMETLSQVMRLADKSRFRDVVKRSCLFRPNPVSEQIYWIHNGEAKLLEEV